MKRLLMAFTAIAAVAVPLAAPLQALAQDRQVGREQRDADRPQSPRISRGDRPNQARPETPSRPDRPRIERPRPERPRDEAGPGRVDRPNRPDRPQTWGQRPDRPDNQGRPNRPDRPEGGWNRPDRPDRPNDGGRPSRPDRPDNGGNRPDRPDRPNGGWNNGPNRPDRPNPGWNQGRDRHEDFRRRFNGDQWRRDFYRNHRADWWRNDRRFRGYTGVRVGFYFAPGWGYYSVPRSYFGRYWGVGDYLPDIFWRYRLDDWRTYGLGYPPAGTRWVLVDNTIYLIDEYDGYIIDVIRDAWRW